MSKTILMLATFGLEIVEVGGTLALHAQAGDNVHAAVLLSRETSRPQIEQAAKILGVKSVQFLGFNYGEVQPDIPSKVKLVRVFRELKPDILITQDPEHSYHDLDPDRRLAMLLYLESVAIANRDWRIAECGGFAPHSIRDIYYMSPEHANCVVEIGTTFTLKQKALDELGFQLSYSAQVMKERIGDAVLHNIVPNYDAVKDDHLELGRALHHEMDRALAMYHGVLSHSGAAMAEAFRYQGQFKFDKLM
ncbi:MAG: GlcNAc-PI de-N-acetylase [Chloroflexi bacterium]|nr:GlcNAc-PI de-N-acetylase [Chloroflexota bacterium]